MFRTRPSRNILDHRCYLNRGGLLGEHPPRKGHPREDIQNDNELEVDEAEETWDAGDVDENGVVGILAAHESWFCFLLEELRDWVPWRLFFQNPPDGSLRDAVACSGEDLRDAFVATETRPSHQMDEAPHRIGETSNGRLRSTREPTDSLSAFTSRSQRVTVLTETQQRVAVSLRDQPRSFLSSRIRNRWCGV